MEVAELSSAGRNCTRPFDNGEFRTCAAYETFFWHIGTAMSVGAPRRRRRSHTRREFSVWDTIWTKVWLNGSWTWPADRSISRSTIFCCHIWKSAFRGQSRTRENWAREAFRFLQLLPTGRQASAGQGKTTGFRFTSRGIWLTLRWVRQQSEFGTWQLLVWKDWVCQRIGSSCRMFKPVGPP